MVYIMWSLHGISNALGRYQFSQDAAHVEPKDDFVRGGCEIQLSFSWFSSKISCSAVVAQHRMTPLFPTCWTQIVRQQVNCSGCACSSLTVYPRNNRDMYSVSRPLSSRSGGRGDSKAVEKWRGLAQTTTHYLGYIPWCPRSSPPTRAPHSLSVNTRLSRAPLCSPQS